MPSRPWSIEELAAGNARGLPGGDPFAAPASHARDEYEAPDKPMARRLVAVRQQGAVRPGRHRSGIVARILRRFR